MSRVTPENPGEVPMVLPDLQGWAAAHILAHTEPADTQPAQPGSAASAGFTALVNCFKRKRPHEEQAPEAEATERIS